MCWANATQTTTVDRLQKLARLHLATASACRLAAVCSQDTGGWRTLSQLGTQSDRFAQALLGQADSLAGIDAPFTPPHPSVTRPAIPVDCDNAMDALRLHRERLTQAYDRVLQHSADAQTRQLLEHQRAELLASEPDWDTLVVRGAVS